MNKKVWSLLIVLTLLAVVVGVSAVLLSSQNGEDSVTGLESPISGRQDSAERPQNENFITKSEGDVSDAIAPIEEQTQPLALSTAASAMEPASGQAAPGGIVAQSNTASVATPAPVPPEDMFFDDYGVNPFLDTADDHLSTFAMDVDTASYTVARNYLMSVQQLPPAESIRPEEFINYFDTDYAPPTNEESFAIHLDAAPAPFGFENHYLMRVGIQGRTIAPEDRDPAFLTFVIDVSGSMDMENRLGLVKEALAILVGELREDDRVAIAVYSDNSRVVLEPTPASESEIILDAINALQPEGSTNVDAGLRLAYDLAEKNMREGEITRVIVLSDGVANVDVTSPNGILKNIQDGVESGITLSTIGFGMGNYNDVLMEQLANDGNGNYYYIDNLRQARRVFVNSLTGTLQVIGYDAKVQVDFNPEITDRYRLIGYENRAVADEDFRNDDVDAGEVGAGHSITALYELALEEGDLAPADVVATVYIRYEDAETREVVEQNQVITVADLMSDINEAPASFRLHAAAAEFAELLRESYWAEDGNYVDLLSFVTPLEEELGGDEQVVEFVDMIRHAGRYVDVGG